MGGEGQPQNGEAEEEWGQGTDQTFVRQTGDYCSFMTNEIKTHREHESTLRREQRKPRWEKWTLSKSTLRWT